MYCKFPKNDLFTTLCTNDNKSTNLGYFTISYNFIHEYIIKHIALRDLCLALLGTMVESVSNNKCINMYLLYNSYGLKGTVQRKLTWVQSGINRKLMIWSLAAWGLF
jgi:hypothetical protein